MARATILSSLGAGLYRIQLHFDNSRIATRLAHMETKIADYAAELAALEPDKTTKTAALNTALTALNDYINATDPAVYVADPTELNALNKATWTARGELDVIRHDEKLLKLKKAALEQETANLNKLCPADFETNAWCVDYVTNKSGESEAIVCDYALWRDVANNQIEHDTGVWLPAAVTPPQDNLIHPLASSEHATWFNLCMAPAAQRHAGRYRIATISNLNKTLDTCDLDFEGRYDVVRANGNVLDSEQIYPQFASGQQSSYSGANIVYGTCNADAFANGDRVIVDLHSGVGTPTVIGFYSNPRQCPNPIPWYNVSLEYAVLQLINIYHADHLVTLGTHSTGAGYSHGVVHGIDSLGGDLYFEFKLHTQQYFSALKALGVPMGLLDTFEYALSYFTASIPAALEIGPITGYLADFPLNNYKMVGGQIINVTTGAVAAVSYTIDSYPAPYYYTSPVAETAIESSGFTMNYNGPATPTGIYPSGSGTKAYVYNKTTTVFGSPNRYYIEWKPQP